MDAQCRILGVIGALMMAGGACLMAQAYRSQWTAAFTGRMRAMAERGRARDAINTASKESFPASDPPSWTPTVIGKPARADA